MSAVRRLMGKSKPVAEKPKPKRGRPRKVKKEKQDGN